MVGAVANSADAVRFLTAPTGSEGNAVRFGLWILTKIAVTQKIIQLTAYLF